MTTAIEWTDTTWNPTTGCDRVSPGCDHCYALTMAKRLKAMGSAKYQRDGDPRTSGPGFGLSEHPDVLGEPLRWRKPRRVFVNSMSDLFHQGVSDEFIARVWAVMAVTPQHTYQVLTKRHGRMRSLLGCERWPRLVRDGLTWLVEHVEAPMPAERFDAVLRWAEAPEFPDETLTPLPNVWLGVSVEDQQRANLRIPALLDTPATVRFLSCEPLLGPVDLTSWTQCRHDSETGDEGPVEHLGRMPRRWRCDHCSSVRSEITTGPDDGITGWRAPGLHWVIAGGESGAGARPMHPDWARALRDQCTDAVVPFFFKQWGDYGPSGDLVATKGTGWASVEEVTRLGKKAAGRELDGRTWDEFPRRAS